jgi:hypothetical protein
MRQIKEVLRKLQRFSMVECRQRQRPFADERISCIVPTCGLDSATFFDFVVKKFGETPTIHKNNTPASNFFTCHINALHIISKKVVRK